MSSPLSLAEKITKFMKVIDEETNGMCEREVTFSLAVSKVFNTFMDKAANNESSSIRVDLEKYVLNIYIFVEVNL